MYPRGAAHPALTPAPASAAVLRAAAQGLYVRAEPDFRWRVWVAVAVAGTGAGGEAADAAARSAATGGTQDDAGHEGAPTRRRPASAITD